MNNAKHTPGPWRVQDKLNVVDSEGNGVFTSTKYEPEEREANVTLGAAAPVLLAAAQRVLRYFEEPAPDVSRYKDPHVVHDEMIEQVRAAVSMATQQ